MRNISLSRPKLIGALVLVALIVAMVLNTRFVTPKELASLGPQTFDPEATAAELFEKASAELPQDAKPLPEVVRGIQKDPKAAAEELDAVRANAGTVVFKVTATGTVTQASPDAIQLKVDGVPTQTTVIVPLTVAVNGTALRDAMGFKFADAPGQSAFQFVGDELKTLMQAEAKKGLADPAAAKGKQVTVVGVITVPDDGSPAPAAKPVNIQPVTVRVG